VRITANPVILNPYQSLVSLYSHPYNRENPAGAVWRFLRWHFHKRLIGKKWIAEVWGGRKAIFYPDSRESMFLAYNHVRDWTEFTFMRRFLHESDLAIDVGANIGVYTLWLSTCIGEQGHTRNRNICVTNKLFTYLLAGVPFVATDTDGQRRVCEDLPEATRSVPSGSRRRWLKLSSRYCVTRRRTGQRDRPLGTRGRSSAIGTWSSKCFWTLLMTASL
jgi:hypothetical protein